MSGARDSSLTARLRLAALLVPGTLAAGLVLAACGGSSGSDGPSSGTATGETSAYIVKSGDTVAAGEANIVVGSYPTGHDTDEENASGKQTVKPCNLVTVREAQAILGGGVKRSEHLQGPTCIFSGSGREISLTLEEASLTQLRHEARKATPLDVGGPRAWCLKYEKTSVAVAIHSREVLVVRGPCQAGVRFAEAALAKL